MREMMEAAFSYRSLYLMCVRSQEMAMHLQMSALDRGDELRANTLGCEVMELAAEAQRWFIKWERAGGEYHAPITTLLPMRRTTLDTPGTFDMSNIIMFPVPKEDVHA